MTLRPGPGTTRHAPRLARRGLLVLLVAVVAVNGLPSSFSPSDTAWITASPVASSWGVVPVNAKLAFWLVLVVAMDYLIPELMVVPFVTRIAPPPPDDPDRPPAARPETLPRPPRT